MAHHAYFFAGNNQIGEGEAFTFAREKLGRTVPNDQDILIMRYRLFSVDEARKLSELVALAPTSGDKKIVILGIGRMFHEAQNALLKVFEEPPAGVTLILIIPSEGMLLPTLRSRLVPLPQGKKTKRDATAADAFIAAHASGREKMIEKLLDQAKSDTDDEKQAAREAARELAEGLMVRAYEAYRAHPEGNQAQKLKQLLDDLSRFLPILHERSAPLKQIFEHLLIVTPSTF